MADRIAVLNLGVLQQYASPIEIYNNPANLFVAKFIGSPSMNLLPCRLVTDGGGNRLDFGAAGSIVITDPQLMAQSRKAHNSNLVLGTRPEQLELRSEDGNASSLRMTTTFVERVGARTIVHLEQNGLIVKVAEKNGYRAERGEPRSIILPQARATLFDAESGWRVQDEDH
jgi:multiple sugar transport system ATP-binding protein